MKIGNKIENRKAIKNVISVAKKINMQEKYIRCRQPYLLQQTVNSAPIKANVLNKIINP